MTSSRSVSRWIARCAVVGLVAAVLPAVLLSAPSGIAVAPSVNGPLIVVADYDAHQDIILMNTDGSGRVNLTGEDKAYVVYSPQGSPDGRRIVFSRSVLGSPTDQIYVMDYDGANKTPLTTPEQGGGSMPTWSPDGSRIAFVRDTDIWTMDSDGTDQAVFANEEWSLSAPEWSPDGERIAYVRDDQAAGSRVLVKNVAGGTPTVVTAYNDRVRRPSWSPDGQKLLFWHDSANVHGLYTASPTSSAPVTLVRAITSANMVANAYAWSPDGTKITFVSKESGDEEVWIADADGDNATQVTPNADGFDHDFVSWMAPPALDPTPLPDQVQGITMAPIELPFGGAGPATYSVTGGNLPAGLTLSGAGTLSGTPSLWGDYVFEVTAIDGVITEEITYSMHVFDPESPSANVTSPPISTTSSASVTLSLVHTVRWAGGDATSGVASYDVRHRRAPWNGAFGGAVTPSDWQELTVKARNHDLALGSTYCYSARATDRSGRTGVWSSERCTIAPLDQTSMAQSSGWKTKTSSGLFRGSALRTLKKGATLKRTNARLTRVGIVATTCPACGKVAVFVGKKRIGRINLGRGKSTLNRKVLLLPRFALRSGTVKVKVISNGKLVQIDGLVVGQT